MAKTIPVTAKLDAEAVAAVDSFRQVRGLSRSAAIAAMVRIAEAAEGVPGGSVVLPVLDPDVAMPASDELWHERSRRALLERAEAGSSSAAVELARTLRATIPPAPEPAPRAEDADPFDCFDAIPGRARAVPGADQQERRPPPT